MKTRTEPRNNKPQVKITLFQSPAKPTDRYWTVLYCTALYCTLLYSTVLYYSVLYSIVLNCTVLYCTVMHCNVLYCTVLYCTVLYCRHTRGAPHVQNTLFPFNKCNIQAATYLQMIWAEVTATLCPENKTVGSVLRDAVCVIMCALGFGGSAVEICAFLGYDRRFETACWSHFQGHIAFTVITFSAKRKLRPSLPYCHGT